MAGDSTGALIESSRNGAVLNLGVFEAPELYHYLPLPDRANPPSAAKKLRASNLHGITNS